MHEQATKFIDYLDTLTAVPGELRRGPTALDGMDLAQHRAPGHCFERGPSADLLIVAQQNIAASSVRFDLGFGWREHFCASPTAVHVIPADADARWRLDGESQCVFLALSDRQAKSLLEELRVPQPADCLWTLASRGFDDAYVHEMVLQLWREVTTLGPNPLLASSCRVALLHALGRRFQRGGRDARAVPKLGQAALARVLAAMHELPASGLSVEGLAQLAGLSAGGVAIPLSALRTDRPAPYVQVVEGERVAHREVTPGARGEGQGPLAGQPMVAVQGLPAGATVLLGHVGALREGTAVKFTRPAP